jgi:ATP-dependent Clp protease protease subunit
MSKEIVQKENKFENAAHWLAMGIDLDCRRIQLDMDVNDIMASLVIRSLLKMSDMSNDPIEIYLSSYGGEAYAGFSIYDAIRSCPCDVIIYASGKLMSMGPIIFLAGDVRIAAKHTTFMLHSVSSGTEGKIKDQEIDVLSGKRINDTMLNILAERTKMKKTWWYRKILSHDFYFDLTEAKEYGIINNVTVKSTVKEKTNVRKPARKKRRN